ncbi:AGC family protein kinase [Ectocarpus siliculosus]|uniref:AGC family protein kinase n=1 Tax=Ectocarpus siliculosus TaxID=2880 RepID=D7G1Z6_ECTSI|nr:AGC family protein kinase [Ectocarpus siliculosus]|eukprot:CBJ48722.1 AGC family protein kinase [Ectocarpus siliculosus]
MELSELSMEMISMSSAANNKMADGSGGGSTAAALGHHSQSSTNMSKSISGASLSSSQATHRTQCSSGMSSVSARLGNLSSSPASPLADTTTTTSGAGAGGAPAVAAAAAGHPHPVAAAPVAGGGKTVLAGVAPSCFGKLRRRGRFSKWRESVYFELRSTALLAFTDNKPGKNTGTTAGAAGGGGGSSSSGGSFACLAAKIMHPRHSAHAGVEWGWSMDLCGAERVVELPGSTKKDTFAFAVEFPARDRKKTLVLAAPTAVDRERWMAAMDKAKRCVHAENFEPLSVIGEGHFATIDEGAEEGGGREGGGYAIGEDVDKARADEAETDAEDADTDAEAADATTKAADATTKANTIANTKPASSSKYSDRTVEDSISRSGRHGCDRYLAVKEVALHKGTSLPGVLNERQILGVLQEHPFVVTLRCAWRRGNYLYYGLDFLPGADLFELFRRNAIKMDLQSARVYGGQVALALEHLHNHGICYRDLKPENILVDAKGHLCLADMGLSKILGTGENAVRTMTVCGTRAYLAPEMVLRKPYGLSVDFWQFGCFVYELYAGHSPFWKPRSGPPGRSHDQTVALILAGEIHFPRSIGPVAKALIKDLLGKEVEARLGCRPSSPSSSSVPPPPAAPASSAAAAGAAGGSSRGPGTLAARPAAAAGGWLSVKQHGFFKDMDWEALLRGDVAAPIKPAGMGRSMVGNFAREYTRQRAGWGGDQQELRDVAEKEGLFKRELMGFDFVRG